MIIPNVRQPEYDVQTIAPLTLGLDMVTDPRLADPRSLSDCDHIIFDDSDIRHREKFTFSSAGETTFGSGHIRGIGAVSGQLWRIKDANLEYLDEGTGNWTIKSAVTTGNFCTFKTFFGRAGSTSATGTTSGTSSSRVLTTSGLTESAHIGRLLRITSGSGN